MPNNNKTLSDREIIDSITKGLDLTKASDIKKVYSALQTGQYNFVTKEGRDFDDRIFDLYQKVKSGEITDAPDTKGKGSNKRSNKVSNKVSNKGMVSKNSIVTEQAVRNDNGLNKNLKGKSTSDNISTKNIDELVSLELRKRERKHVFGIIILTLIAVASLGYFGYYYFMSTRTNVDYEELSNLKGSDVLAKQVDNKKSKALFHISNVATPDILDDYKTLYAKNNKLAGWLKIDGTKIDYPVMQTNNNDYYLTHNYNQEKDNNGSLFLDCECQLFPQSTNMIIYGHHMKSGNMFGHLQKYAKESYWKEHPTITFDTIYEKGTYEVMYAFYSRVYDNDDLVFKYYQFIDANSETEFDYYMSEMQNMSLYDTGVKASFGDKLLTLSTCDHSQTDGRFAVVAKRIQ